MRHVLVLAVLLATASLAQAAPVTETDFRINDAQDLVDLCSVSAGDPLADEAIHFCHGYLVGAYHFQESMYAGPKEKPLVCPPDPRPTRDQAVQQFVVWVRAHPQYKGERPVDTLMRFLTETWPCK